MGACPKESEWVSFHEGAAEAPGSVQTRRAPPSGASTVAMSSRSLPDGESRTPGPEPWHAGNGRVGDGGTGRTSARCGPSESRRDGGRCRSPVRGGGARSPSGAPILNDLPREGKRFLKNSGFFCRRPPAAALAGQRTYLTQFRGVEERAIWSTCDGEARDAAPRTSHTWHLPAGPYDEDNE